MSETFEIGSYVDGEGRYVPVTIERHSESRWLVRVSGDTIVMVGLSIANATAAAVAYVARHARAPKEPA